MFATLFESLYCLLLMSAGVVVCSVKAVRSLSTINKITINKMHTYLSKRVEDISRGSRPCSW